MSDEVTEIQTKDAPCFDPECAGLAEPESDGELAWFTCEECGSEFGYERIKAPDSTCAIGVPESIRRSYAQQAKPETPNSAVSVEIGRRNGR